MIENKDGRKESRMEQYKIEKDGDTITVWDTGSIIGIRFTKDGTLQRYVSELVMRSESPLATIDVLSLSRISDQIKKFAIEYFPSELGEIR